MKEQKEDEKGRMIDREKRRQKGEKRTGEGTPLNGNATQLLTTERAKEEQRSGPHEAQFS